MNHRWSVVLLALCLTASLIASMPAFGQSPEVIWKALENLPAAEREKRLIEGARKEGRVVAHPKVEPIYPRMKELQSYLGTARVQLNTVEQNHKLYKDGIQILDEVILKHRPSSL
jgi:hypothetical protein